MAKTHGDESGLLWQTQVYIGRSAAKDVGLKGPKLSAPADYKLPEYRSILGHKRITLDIETHDPKLEEKGPGVYRKDGFILGIAIGYSDGDNRYYPLRHSTGDNFDPSRFLSVLGEEASKFDGVLVNANLQYDLDWLGSEGVHFTNCKFFDVQYAEPLLDENRMSYKLDLLGQQYLGIGKETNTLEKHYGPDFIKHLKDIHPAYVGEYACGDVYLPPLIMDKQVPLLEEQGLTELCEMEHGLLPLLLQMRSSGVRINLTAAEKAFEACNSEALEIASKIRSMVGFDVDIFAAESLARAFDKLGVTYPKTKTGKPSFQKAWLKAHNSPLAKLLMDKRALDKTSGTFIRNYMLQGHVNGRIHCLFHPLRGEEGGAVSGRFSSSGPNLQNIPSRDGKLGPMCREIFIPEEGCDWGRIDWSQIEYRFLVHYAVAARCRDAEKAADLYRNNRETDFHSMAANIVHPGKEVTKSERDRIKSVNFGIAYGMGINGLARDLGVSKEEAEPILKEFYTRLPWLKEISSKAMDQASTKGYIKTILGRRQRFDMWELKGWGESKGYLMRDSYEKLTDSEKRNYRRARVHKALNALLQGSAADLMKLSMVTAFNKGLFKVLTPHITVHDELGVSVPRTSEGVEAFQELIDVMENVLPLNVPVLASAKLAENWNEAK